MISARFECEVSLADRPVINLFTNTNAQVSLAGAAGSSVNLSRLTGYTANAPYSTAFRATAVGNAQSFFNIDGDNGALRNGMEAGKTYTARATVTLAGALGGSVHAAARTIQLTYRKADGTFVDTLSPAAPNAAGTYDLAVTVAIPAGATQAFVRFNHGHSTGASDWYRLRLSEGVETDFFDGRYTTPDPNSKETGWDGAAGLSRSWRIPGSTVLPEAVFTDLSYGRKRVPFVAGTITMPYPGDAVWAQLEPRVARERIIYFTVRRLNDDGTVHSRLPRAIGGDPRRGKLWLREVHRDLITETVTLTVKSGEVKLEDKKRMAGGVLDTAAGTLEALWAYAHRDVGEAASLEVASNDPAAVATVIPAGDRRLWMPGESASNLFEAELAGTDPPLRSYCDDTGAFVIQQFTRPPGGFTAANIDLYAGDAGTLISAELTLSRETGWADSTLVKASYTDGAGTQQTKYQNDTAGKNVAGQVVTINRDIPGASSAAAFTVEAARKGGFARVTALADFNVRAGRDVYLWRAPGELIARVYIVDEVSFDLVQGTMTFTGPVLS